MICKFLGYSDGNKLIMSISKSFFIQLKECFHLFCLFVLNFDIHCVISFSLNHECAYVLQFSIIKMFISYLL